jgi:hypothetical protein
MLKGEKGETGYSISNIQMNDDYTLTITIENGMQFNTPPIRGEKGEQGTGIRSVELRDDYSLLFTLDNGETLETTAILGKEFENIRTLEASATSASKIATSASTSASASAQSASEASISASESASNASTSASASAQSATNASQSATNAQESATSASTSADTATSKATEASASATKAKEYEMNAKLSETNASNSAKEAEASAVNAKASETKAEEYANNLQNSTEAINQLKEDLVANTKEDAKTKRSLSALWDLNNGISYRFETDSEKAYKKQIPSGAKLGAVKLIGGRTIVYNQYFTEKNLESNGVKVTYADGVITLNGTATQNWVDFSQLNEKLNVIGKFYIKMTIIKNDNHLNFYYGWLNRLTRMSEISSGSESIIYSQTTKELEKASNTGIANFGSGAKFNDVKIKIIMVNLTQMFGSGNEPTTTAEFEAMFPNDYYPYNEGTLMSMSVNNVAEQGKNYFDFSKVPQGSIMGTDGDKVAVDHDKKTITIPSKTYYANLQRSLRKLCPNITPGTYIFSINRSNTESVDYIHLLGGVGQVKLNKPVKLTNADLNCDVVFYNNASSDNENVMSNIQVERASTATAYSPYHESTYPIPQAIQNLEGYGWGVNNVYNYVDYENKKFVKRVGRVDLGTLNFSYGTYGNDNEYHVFRTLLPSDIKKDENAYLHTNNLLCSRYTDTPWNNLWSNGADKAITQTSNNINITDSSFTDAEAFKNSLKGEYLYYELATPIVTDISDIIGDTFQEPFEVESGGSLTFKNTNGDGYQLAVPSNIQYVVSLKEVTS